MNRLKRSVQLQFCAMGVFTAALAGCDLSAEDIADILEEIEITINAEVDNIQDEDPRDIDLPDVFDGTSNTIIINEEVTVINVIEEDIIVEELPDVTVLGFENLTGFDAYIRYLVDGELQGIFVFDGETLLLEYPCLADVELLSEDYIDPFTGELVASFDDTGIVFFNPDHFQCGDLFILTFDVDGVFASAEAIDLGP